MDRRRFTPSRLEDKKMACEVREVCGLVVTEKVEVEGETAMDLYI